MNDIIRSLRRSDRRFAIDRNADLTVTLDKCDGTSELIVAELLDISAQGAKFKIKQPIAVEDVVAVRIEFNEPKQIIATSGKVRRVSPGDDWWFGCEFEEPIKAEVLCELSQSGVLERRENLRREVSVDATAKWELHCDTVPVRILDYSPDGGFCITSTHAGEPGQRVQLQFKQADGTAEVCGIARWQVETESGYVVGCEQHQNSPSIGSFISRQPSEEIELQIPLVTPARVGALSFGMAATLVYLSFEARPVVEQPSVPQPALTADLVTTKPVAHVTSEVDDLPPVYNPAAHELAAHELAAHEPAVEEPPIVAEISRPEEMVELITVAAAEPFAEQPRANEANVDQADDSDVTQGGSMLAHFDQDLDSPLVPSGYSQEAIELPLLEQSVMDLLQSPTPNVADDRD